MATSCCVGGADSVLLKCGMPARANVATTPSRGVKGIGGANFRLTLGRQGGVKTIGCDVNTGVTAGGGGVAGLNNSSGVVRADDCVIGCVLGGKRSVNSFCKFGASKLCARTSVSTKRCCALDKIMPGTNSVGFIPRHSVRCGRRVASRSHAVLNGSMPSFACNMGLDLRCGNFRFDVFKRKVDKAGMTFSICNIRPFCRKRSDPEGCRLGE